MSWLGILNTSISEFLIILHVVHCLINKNAPVSVGLMTVVIVHLKMINSMLGDCEEVLKSR